MSDDGIGGMRTRSEIGAGWAIHCHHDRLVEWCYDYRERYKYIRACKPPHEVATRLRLFRLLPPEAVAELPAPLRVAGLRYERRSANFESARHGLERAQWQYQPSEEWHAKWCGCKEWNGKRIVFDRYGYLFA